MIKEMVEKHSAEFGEETGQVYLLRKLLASALLNFEGSFGVFSRDLIGTYIKS